MEINIYARTSGGSSGGGGKGGGTSSSGGSSGGSKGGNSTSGGSKVDSGSASGGGIPQPGVSVPTKKPGKVEKDIDLDALVFLILVGGVTFIVAWFIIRGLLKD